jgi:hypothetical protein
VPFEIPNEADAAVAAQAEPDKVDFDIITAGSDATGVLSGCAVTAQGTPNLTVHVAAGTVIVAGTQASVTAGDVTITTPDATDPRFDLIVSSNAGALSAVAGTPASHPAFPAIPASSVVLAAVYVAANAASVGSTAITDKRVVVLVPTLAEVLLAGNDPGGTGSKPRPRRRAPARTSPSRRARAASR